MKKHANDIEFKKQELRNSIDEALSQLNIKMQEVAKEVSEQAFQDMQQVIQNLQNEVNQKLNEISNTSTQTIPAGMQPAADDGKNKGWNVREFVGKTWREIQELVGGKSDENYGGENLVSGVRGSFKNPLTAGKTKRKKSLSPRDSDDNPNLPDFWRENYDYGESPYIHMDKLNKITDEVPDSAKKRKTKNH